MLRIFRLKIHGFAPKKIIFLCVVVVFVVMLMFIALSLGSREVALCPIAIPREEIDRAAYADTYKPFDCVQLERADTDETRQKGLSGRHHLASTAGMLFVFDTSAKQCMWMKNMNFALDIIWLNENKKIVKIQENVKPETYPAAFCSDVLAKYVIEVNAGIVHRAGLKTGQILQF